MSKSKDPIFVIQKHQASRLHYDFRLEIDGVLKSWAIPKGPSTNPKDKRLAVPTEDHQIEYADFEGVISEGYGAGTVMVWDTGTYKNISKQVSMVKCYKNGRIEIFLHGKKLKGAYALVKFASKSQWLLIKMNDEYADSKHDIVKTKPDSAVSGRSIKEIESFA
jgi:DNA ligase D-like protein (predicted 3'-phosphoesterase)